MYEDSLMITEIGAGQVESTAGRWRLTLPPVTADRYHDAQISTYRHRREFACVPPLRLRLRAFAEQTQPTGALLRGTAGFGLWNHPFVPGERGVRLPKALWFFFAAPPNDMRLALDQPGHGWKAATFDATRPAFLALLPAAPLGFALMRVPALYRRLWPLGQRALGVHETQLDPVLLTTPHDYGLDWMPDGVTFSVDGVAVYHAAVQIGGPLGFIAWIDNQYAVVTPQGRVGFGLVPVPAAQALVIDRLHLSGPSVHTVG